MLVQVPPGPLAEGDVLWALSGRPFFDPRTGEFEGTTLAAATADEMVGRYRATSRTWRSVTPLALGSASRRRIEPKRQREEPKSAGEREAEERAARHAVAQALRHAGLDAALVRAHVQREPFDAHGTRAERFTEPTIQGVHIELQRVQTWLFAVPRLRAMVGANVLLGETLRVALSALARETGRWVLAPTLAYLSRWHRAAEEPGVHLDRAACARPLRVDGARAGVSERRAG